MTDRSKARRGGSGLDSIAARIVAFLILLAVAAALLSLHWDDLFPPDTAGQAGADDAVSRCIAQRIAEIDQMLADNPDMADRRAVFVQRATAMCEATEGGGTAPAQ